MHINLPESQIYPKLRTLSVTAQEHQLGILLKQQQLGGYLDRVAGGKKGLWKLIFALLKGHLG